MPYTKWYEIIEVSKNRDNDKYNELGQNISSQKRRQELVQWNIVSRKQNKIINNPKFQFSH